MAIQSAIQQAILYVGNTINTHIILHSRICSNMPSMAAWLGAMAQSTAHASKVHTVEIPGKPGYDQYCRQ